MRFVIYDEYLEPITVVSLPGMTGQVIEEHGRHWDLPVRERMTAAFQREEAIATMTRMKVVTLKFEPIRRGEHSGWMCFTKQDEWAMLLDSVLLPGQRRDHDDLRAVNAAITDTLIRGIFKGLR